MSPDFQQGKTQNQNVKPANTAFTSGTHYIMDYRTNTGIVQRGEQNCTCTYTGERTISIIDGEIQCSAYVRNETLVCKGENENV